MDNSNNQPTVEISVVMSVYNTEKFLKEAMDSILSQSYTQFEFIIVNDGSTDQSSEVIKSYDDERIRLIEQKNLGLSKALNTGIANAKGKFIARMDADDIATKDRLEKQYLFMFQNPDYAAIGSSASIIDVDGNYLYTHHVKTSWEEIKVILPETPIYHSSAFFRKDIWEQVGGYNEKVIKYCEDKILWNDMAKLGKLSNLSDALIRYRLSPNSITHNDERVLMKLRVLSNLYLKEGNWKDGNIEKFQAILSTPVNPQIRHFNYHLRIGHIYLNENRNIQKALLEFLKCIALNPLNHHAWMGLLYCVIPKRIFKFLKEIKRRSMHR